MKKIICSMASLLLVFGFITMVSADTITDSTTLPEISKIKERTKNSMQLKIHDPEHKKKEVDIKISIKNKKTHKRETKTFKNVKLDSKGEEYILIDLLHSNTKYEFKTKTKKSTQSEYSDYSEIITAKTK